MLLHTVISIAIISIAIASIYTKVIIIVLILIIRNNCINNLQYHILISITYKYINIYAYSYKHID